MDTTRLFKDNAKAAAAYLAEQGFDVPHTRILEALSRSFGERNWSTLRAQLAKLQGDTLAVVAGPESEPLQPAAWDATAGVPMTDTQFTRYSGNRCPFCGSHDLEASGLEADGSIAWDHTECENCGSTWATSYSVCGYFNGVAGENAPTPSAAESLTNPSTNVAAILQSLQDDQGIMLVGLDESGEDWLGHVFRAKDALPVLADLLGDTQRPTNAEEMLAYVTADHGLVVDRLVRDAQVSPVWVNTGIDERGVRQAAETAAATAGLKLIAGLREDIIEELVSDVRDRARDHGFSYSGYRTALRLVNESAEVLDSDATEAEMFEAATRLA